MADIALTPLAQDDAPALLAFEIANRAWFEAWVPARPPGYWQEGSLAALIAEQAAGPDAMYLVRRGPTILGRLNLTRIEAGAAYLGYRIGRTATGRGIATRAVTLGLDAARGLGLATVNTLVKPDNPASARVLEKTGFLPVATDETFHTFRRALDEPSPRPQFSPKGDLA